MEEVFLASLVEGLNSSYAFAFEEGSTPEYF
jgi:hypothetical protein